MEEWVDIVALHRQGVSMKAISRELGSASTPSAGVVKAKGGRCHQPDGGSGLDRHKGVHFASSLTAARPLGRGRTLVGPALARRSMPTQLESELTAKMSPRTCLCDRFSK